jgi:hypothetical protein
MCGRPASDSRRPSIPLAGTIDGAVVSTHAQLPAVGEMVQFSSSVATSRSRAGTVADMTSDITSLSIV